MITGARNLVGALVLGTAVLVSPVASASAAPVAAPEAQVQVADGLVNVQVGNVTILRNVSVAVAAQVVAQICGVTVQGINVLASQVDQTGNPEIACQTRRNNQTVPVTILDN
jgi:hypothetical protein